jgi:curved DNA-binding protein CbpA
MTMTDHYELLGVGSDATKDEIKAAYRSEVDGADSSRRAQLNRAWNVLSDPIQRQRYDEQLHSGDGGGSDSGETAVVVSGRRATGARRGPEGTTVDTNGSSNNGSGKNGGGGGRGGGGGGGGDDGSDDDVPMRGGRPIPQPTVVLPEGMHLAAKRQRGYSITFDLSVLAVMYVLFVSLLIPLVLKDQYPKKVDRIDAISNQVDKLDNKKSAAEDKESKANDHADAARKKGDSAAATQAKQDAKDAKSNANQYDKQITKLQDEASNLQNDMLGTTYLMLGGLLVLALLYLVPSTVLTGQTLGKKLRKVWLVRVDGSKVGFGGALAHSAVPVIVALGVPQIGPIVALGIVYWALRDRNEQGFHDKLARTLVVDSPPASS